MSRPRLKTPISYYGGKQTMLKHIIPLIPQHTVYTEAFCGGCAVLFGKEPSDCEVINDLNKELINFYRVAQTQYDDLRTELEASLHSRDQHTHAKHIMTHPQFFTPVQRAGAVWIGSKLGFASMLDGTFGYDRSVTTTLKLFNAKDQFTEVICQRLSKVIIESENGLNVIQRYDCPEAFHFVDPPYVNSDCGHYIGMFNEQHLHELLSVLSKVEGKFMLTMFPHNMIQEFVDNCGWKIHTIERQITASKESRRRQEEWMVTNY